MAAILCNGQLHTKRAPVCSTRDDADESGCERTVIVPLTSGALRLIEPEGTRDAQLTAGISYSRPAGVDHNVINVNAHEFRFIEIELK